MYLVMNFLIKQGVRKLEIGRNNTERRRIKILHVVIGLNMGGIQEVVSNIFKGIDRERFELTACAIEDTGIIGKEIEGAGFEVIVLHYKKQPLRTIYALLKIIKKKRIDIVHAASYHPSLYARIAGMLAGVPILISHEHGLNIRKRPQRVILNRWLEPITDCFIAVGQSMASQVIDWYGYDENKVVVIPNGVDTEKFAPPDSRENAKRKLGLDPERLVVGMLCRLDPDKGHRYFFEAVKLLRDRFDVQWVVVGGGIESAKVVVMQEAKDLSVDSTIRFMGVRRDVADWVAAFDCYVLPTLREGGCPISVLEAMSAACPVVVSDFPTNLEVITHGINGLVAPVGDSRQLAQRIEELLTDADLRRRLGAEARRYIEIHRSIKQYADKIMDIYERLWNDKKGTGECEK